MNITKITLNGKEYIIKDKEAQSVIAELQKRIEELEANAGKIYMIEVD